nr:hypothetical protein [Tanacetum cinerariifolium]
MLTSMQGTDVYNPVTQTNNYTTQPIFSNENGGTIKAFDNYMVGQQRFVPYGAAGYPNSTVDFDAYVWTFNNAVDDASSAVNVPLQTALVNYTTGLVSVQGDGPPAVPAPGPGTGTAGMVHNFTLAGTASSFYTITGNLSTSQGTVV